MARGNGFKETVDSLFGGLDGFFAAKSVVGEPIVAGDTTIIPLADVSFGIGAGAFGGEENEKDGGGAGAKMTPCAILVIQKGGAPRLISVKNSDGISKVIDLVPDIVSRFTPGSKGAADGDQTKKNTGKEKKDGSGQDEQA